MIEVVMSIVGQWLACLLIGVGLSDLMVAKYYLEFDLL